jgi:hypothetical protein
MISKWLTVIMPSGFLTKLSDRSNRVKPGNFGSQSVCLSALLRLIR